MSGLQKSPKRNNLILYQDLFYGLNNFLGGFLWVVIALNFILEFPDDIWWISIKHYFWFFGIWVLISILLHWFFPETPDKQDASLPEEKHNNTDKSLIFLFYGSLAILLFITLGSQYLFPTQSVVLGSVKFILVLIGGLSLFYMLSSKGDALKKPPIDLLIIFFVMIGA